MNRLESLLDFAKEHVAFHRKRCPPDHLDLANWPLMTMDHVATHSLDVADELLADASLSPGYIVASGGTMGKPKYLNYAHEEAVIQSANIAKNFASNGLIAGDRIVNYFTSGDMWSSFLLVDRALASLPVTIFPLGCTPRTEFALQIIGRFKPNVIAGIPSMLLDLARAGVASGLTVRMQKVYYAGEPMSVSMMDLLRSIWGCESIRSAGYASTDAGTIGWQCLHCETDEYYAFDNVVVEIIDDEIVVTSLSRHAMPIIRYRTGDRGKWVEGSCACGGDAPRFKLKGRLDNNIIIWGCWIAYDEVAAAFQEINVDYTALQLKAWADGEMQSLVVRFEAPEPADADTYARLRDSIYKHCGDLNATVARDFVEKHLLIEAAPLGTLRRNERTGKVVPIIDSRP